MSGAGWRVTVAVAALVTTSAGVPAPVHPAVRTLAAHPVGTFLENLLVEPDGSVLYTSYFDRTVRRHAQDGLNDTFSTMAAHPISLARRGDDLWVIAQTASFADGPGFMRSNVLVRLDRGGRTVESVPAPDARFLNGTADLPGGDLLIADSVAGVIWRFAVSSRTLSVWLRDPLLLQLAGPTATLPGANGVKLIGGRLLVSNTSRGELLEGVVDAAGRPGPLRTLSRTGTIDDFHVEEDGSVVAATHASSVIRICRDGRVRTLLANGVDGATATAATPGRRSILVLTTGTPLGGKPGPAALLEADLPANLKGCGS